MKEKIKIIDVKKEGFKNAGDYFKTKDKKDKDKKKK